MENSFSCIRLDLEASLLVLLEMGQIVIVFSVSLLFNRADPFSNPLLAACIKSVPTENIELYFPLIIEANEALADSGGAGYFRGGNAQRTLYRFLSEGEVSIHDDRWLIKPWGVNGGSPGSRSRKYIYRDDKFGTADAKAEPVPSKCDHLHVGRFIESFYCLESRPLIKSRSCLAMFWSGLHGEEVDSAMLYSVQLASWRKRYVLLFKNRLYNF